MTKLELKDRLNNLIFKLEKDYKDFCCRDLHEDVASCSNDDVVKFYTALNHMECALCDSSDATEFEVEAVNALEIAYKNQNFFY